MITLLVNVRGVAPLLEIWPEVRVRVPVPRVPSAPAKIQPPLRLVPPL